MYTTQKNYTRHYLDDECWVDTFSLPTDLVPSRDQRACLWSLHPQERGKVKIYGKEMESPRWFQSYGRAYRFSQMDHMAVPVPNDIHRYLDYVRNLGYQGPTLGEYNMCLANWYENGGDYIAAHADDEMEMVRESPVVCISFGQERIFRIRKPNPPNVKPLSPIVLNLTLKDGMVYVMGGKMQEIIRYGKSKKPRYTHESPKVGGKKGISMKSRISLTFRQFED